MHTVIVQHLLKSHSDIRCFLLVRKRYNKWAHLSIDCDFALKLLFSLDIPPRGYRSRTNSSSGIGETDFVLLQSSPVGHMHWQPVSISIGGYSESLSEHSSRCNSQPPSPSKYFACEIISHNILLIGRVNE